MRRAQSGLIASVTSLLLVVSALAACSPVVDDGEVAPVPAPSPSSVSPDAVEPSDLPEPSDTSKPSTIADPCNSTTSRPANGALLDVGHFAAMTDLGARNGATGEVTYADDGSLASYVVASGDSFGAVAQRVCAGYHGLEALNAVRRNGLYADFGDSVLYEGDVLNLSPYTITSVGSQNGSSYSHTPVFVLPPQR